MPVPVGAIHKVRHALADGGVLAIVTEGVIHKVRHAKGKGVCVGVTERYIQGCVLAIVRPT